MKNAKFGIMIGFIPFSAVTAFYRRFFPENFWLTYVLLIGLLGLAGYYLYWPLLRPAKTPDDFWPLWTRWCILTFYTAALTIGLADGGFIPSSVKWPLFVVALLSWIAVATGVVVSKWREEDKTHR